MVARPGMTGARITTTLINNLQAHGKQLGVETMVLERLS
jgi:acetyl-CoA C-acetyltransferase